MRWLKIFSKNFIIVSFTVLCGFLFIQELLQPKGIEQLAPLPFEGYEINSRII